MHEAEARVQFGALMVALLKARMFDAADALWDWAEEYLDVTRDSFEEDLDLDDIID